MPRKKENDGFDLKEFFVSFIETFIKKIGTELIEDIKEKSRELLEQLRRKTIVVTLLFLGFIILIIGLSLFLENFFLLKGIGFLVTGFLIIFIGLLINIKK